MKLYKNTEFGKAVQKLFRSLNEIADDHGSDQAYIDGQFKAYIFGGAAVHMYTNHRSSHDVDVEFTEYLPAFKDEDVVVMYLDRDAKSKQLTFDDNFTPVLGLLHEDYIDDAVPFMTEKGDVLWVYLVSPLDLAVSKLARFADHDFDDIKALARAGLVGAESLRERAEFALGAYVGDTVTVSTNIRLAVDAVSAINTS